MRLTNYFVSTLIVVILGLSLVGCGALTGGTFDADESRQALESLGLGWEEHELESLENEPLSFTPIAGTEAEILARHASLRARGRRFVQRKVESDGTIITAPFGNASLTAIETFGDQGTAVIEVQQEGETVHTVNVAQAPPAQYSLHDLWTYDDHWALEVIHAEGEDMVAAGDIIIDGQPQCEAQGYDEAFGFQLLDGQPFHFFRRGDQVGIAYGDEEVLLGYDHVTHYACCSGTVLNLQVSEQMMAFFAWQDETPYYVEIGAF